MDEYDGRNDPQHDNMDPFAGLEDWARDAERRVRREQWLGGLRRKFLVVVGVVSALVVLAVTVSVVHGWAAGGDGAQAYPTQSPAGGVSATPAPDPAQTAPGRAAPGQAGPRSSGSASTGAASTGPGSATSAAVDPGAAGPFAGTPAAGYPKGEAGITLPPAKAVTGFTEAQVGAALQQVRRALVVGRLDNDMLVGHHPARFVALLAPHQRDTIAGWFRTRSFETVSTWIDPAVRLDPVEQPRVSGRVAYAEVRVGGIETLRVTTNFVWVYAFAGVRHPLAVVHDEIRWEFPSTRNLRAGDRGMWIGRTRSYNALVDCAAGAKGLLAPTPEGGGGAPDPRETEDPDAYLRTDHSLDIHDNCHIPSTAPSH